MAIAPFAGHCWLYRDDYTARRFPPPAGDSPGRPQHRTATSSSIIWPWLAVGLLPTLVGLAGTLYFVAAFALGLMFLGFGLELAFARTTAAARRLLLASLVYLPVMFLFMALDKVPQF